MSYALQLTDFMQGFECLGDKCEDTCCKGWGMQLSQKTVDKYKTEAPELLDAVTSGEAEHIMKRDPDTDYCIKFDKGWCGIHATRGTDFLGDACHFFPRVTRAMGDVHIMTASMSCPEVVRLVMNTDSPFALRASEVERFPHSLKDYLPEALSSEQGMTVHQAFIEAAADNACNAERNIAKISSVARSVERIDMASWATAVPFYIKQAETRLPQPEMMPEDPFNLVNALQGLIGASKKTARPRLEHTINIMEQALEIKLDWERLSIQTSEKSWPAYLAMREAWKNDYSDACQPILKRWLQTQLSMALFPFAGFGDTLEDRITIIGVRFATVRLALMSACHIAGVAIPQEEAVVVIQSLARFMDHLADPTLSLQIYTETGWVREARFRSLVGDYG